MTDKPNISLSIMPTYQCNMNCDYCYLPSEATSAKNASKEFETRVLYKRLKELSAKYNISIVEMYGGNLSFVEELRLQEIIAAYRCYCKNERIVWNNVEEAKKLGFKERDIIISLNPERRDFLFNLQQAKANPSAGVITVVTNKLLHQPLRDIFGWYKNLRGNITMMPYNNYSPNYPVAAVSNYEYCAFMMGFIDYYLEHKDEFHFKLTNILMLQDCIAGRYSPAMRNNIFITPDGHFACIDFNVSGDEYFHKFKSLAVWEKRCETEDIDRIKRCGICENFNCCMAEHFKNPEQRTWLEKKHDDICNGYIPLVNWAKERLDGFSY